MGLFDKVFGTHSEREIKRIMPIVDKIESYLRGNICGRKPTSCADQLAIAVRKAYNETHAA